MKLIRFSLKNFKGIRSLEITPDGGSLAIYGKNATGKTTIGDALSWLLFDKDMADKSPAAFGIKTRVDGEPMHNAEHSVEAVFDTVTLKKIYKENWTKKRGSGNKELTSHTTEYFWDDEPISAQVYKTRLADIMPEQRFKILSLPDYFPETLPWKGRRSVLVELAGDVSDSEVIATDSKLARYPQVLDGKTQESRLAILSSQRKETNEQIDSIPYRVDENMGLIKELPDREALDQEIATLTIKRVSLHEKYQSAKSGGGINDIQEKIRSLQGDLDHQQHLKDQEREKSLASYRQKVSELQDKLDESDAQARQAKREYDEAVEFETQQAIALESAELNLKQERGAKYEPTEQKGDCPYCGQPLPDSGDATGEEMFNENKAKRVKEAELAVESAKQKLVKARETLEAKTSQGARVKGKHLQIKAALDKAESALNDAKSKTLNETTDQERETGVKISALRKKLEDVQQANRDAVNDAAGALEAVEQELSAKQSLARQYEANEQYEKRISELRDKQKALAGQLDQIESDLLLIENFNRARASMITDKVNGRFELVTWRLFKEQINGGMTETCDAVVGGVPYSEGLNNGSRIKAGLDIIETLSAHYDQSVPVVIDNAESVTDMPRTDLQIIALYVNQEDLKLRIQKVKK